MRTLVDIKVGFALAVLTSILGSSAIAAAIQPPIVVRNTAELQAALVEQNAGRVILVQRGQYPVTSPLVVPDGVTLQGAGVMLGGGPPSGFRSDTVTRIHAASPFVGDLLTLGDGVALNGLVIEHAPGAIGNVVSVGSRGPGDLQVVSIVACELINPNPTGIGPAGPTGEGVALVARNLNLGAEPPPDEGAQIDLTMRRSIVRAEAGGAALFAINFASRSLTTILLDRNVIAGSLRLVGAVSRPDPVSNAALVVHSSGNLYSGESLRVQLPGWQIYGGGTVPIPLPTGETRDNAVHFTSRGDEVKGFQLAVLAIAGVRQNSVSGPASDNRVDLKLQQLTIRTPDDGLSTDFSLHGASSSVDMSPGENNELTVLARGVSGSGYRNNLYSHTSIQGVPSWERDNVLEFVGTEDQFHRTNRDVLPAPDAEFFSDTIPGH